MLGLAKSSFRRQDRRAFQRNSISFDRQTTQVRCICRSSSESRATSSILRLRAPRFRDCFARASISSAGTSHDGEKMLAAFLDCVEMWTRSVEDQLRTLCAPTPHWNQAAAALELLCVGAAIGGKIKPDANIAE